MRLFTTLILLCLSIACNTPKKITAKSNPLNGTWTPVKQEMAGSVLPAAAFENQKLILADSTYTFSAESVDKGIVTLGNGKMDIYGKEGVNTGKHFTAIYKLENDQLTVCYNLAGDMYPEAFDTKGKPKYFLCVYRKN
ncbi:MAG: TIGR03067 domain-containing protein [Chitinophagales bacterium]